MSATARHNTLGVQTVSASSPRLRLRSSSSTDYVLYHDFAPSSVSAPFLTLVHLHGTDYQNAEPDITNFRKLLKTHYFNSAFNVQ